MEVEVLRKLESTIGLWVESFDADSLDRESVESVLALSSRIANRVHALRALAAARLASLSTWEAEGELSAAHQLARRTGTSIGEARESLRTGERLCALPSVSAAGRSGELSRSRLDLIADAAHANPSAADHLLEKSDQVSLSELREACAKAKAQVTDPEKRRRDIHDSRHLRAWTDPDGGWNLKMRDNPEVGARIMAAIDDLSQRSLAGGESLEARRADALTELAREHWADSPSAPSRIGFSAPRPKIIFRIDYSAFLRGGVAEGETMELTGVGPIASSAVAEVLGRDDPFVAVVLARGQQVTHVVHFGRRPNALQTTALEWMQPTCSVEGCSATDRLEFDHRVEWSSDQVTALENIDRLCPHHHRLKTRQGWELVPGQGKRKFLPPARAHPPPRAA